MKPSLEEIGAGVMNKAFAHSQQEIIMKFTNREQARMAKELFEAYYLDTKTQLWMSENDLAVAYNEMLRQRAEMAKAPLADSQFVRMTEQ